MAAVAAKANDVAVSGSRFVGRAGSCDIRADARHGFEWYDFYLYVVLEERRILVRGRKEQLRAYRRTARLRSSQASCLRGWPHDGNQNCSPEAIERLERNLRRCGGVMPPRAAGGAQPGSRAMRPRRLARLSHTSSASQQSAFHGPGQRGRRGSSPTRARLHDKFPSAH
jgi:hypothetical protein